MSAIVAQATADVNFIGEHGTVKQVRAANENLRALKRPMESTERVQFYAKVIRQIRSHCE